VCQRTFELHHGTRDLVSHRSVTLVVVSSRCAVGTVASTSTSTMGGAGCLCCSGRCGSPARSVACRGSGSARGAHEFSLEAGLRPGRPRGAGSGSGVGAVRLCQRHDD